MPSVISHPAVPLGIGIAFGRSNVSARLLAAGILASVVPDLDSIGFAYGVPYGSAFGHRGFFHSLLFAVLLGLPAAFAHRTLATSAKVAFGVVFAAAVSHGVLDAFTSGGYGVAFFSPFSNRRYFLPWHPIAVSPIGLHRFFSAWGLRVIRSEALWVWLPCAAFAAMGTVIRRAKRGAASLPIET